MPAPGCYQEEIILFICEKQQWKEQGDGRPGWALSQPCHGTGSWGGRAQSRGEPWGTGPPRPCPRWEPKGRLLPRPTRWGGDKVTLRSSALQSEEFVLRVSLHNVRMSPSCNFTPEEAKREIIVDDIKLFSENQSYSETGGTFLYEATLFRAQRRLTNTARQ